MEFSGRYFLLSESIPVIEEGGSRLRNNEIEYFDNFISEKPLVSVITVVFNREKEIEKTIDSVLNQTYENVEYIIIDGGSTDNTLEVIKKFQNKISYFVSAGDKGIYQAMNRGISLAKGDFISLINAGDVQSQNFIEDSINLLLTTNGDFSYCRLFGEQCPKNYNSGILLYHMNINHQTFLVTKKTYDKVGPYDENFRVVSDIKWARKAFMGKFNACFLDKELIEFAKGGISDGANIETRKLIFKENSLITLEIFEFLTFEEAEELYRFRFNKYLIFSVVDIVERHYKNDLFKDAVKNYFKYCLAHRVNFTIHFMEIDKLFPVYLKLCKLLDLSEEYIKVPVDYKDTFGNYCRKINDFRKEYSHKDNVLHYVEVFNRASETFVFDVVNRFSSHKNYNSIVICDIRELEHERYFENTFCLKWSQTHPLIREFIYNKLIGNISPKLVISHFLINGVKFSQRIGKYVDSLNFLHMMHGIDVFNLRNKSYQDGRYNDYSLNYLQNKKNHHFTTPSKYLKAYALTRGMKSNKVSVIHNTIKSGFYENRKQDGFYDGQRELKVLSIGRLIDWKGHGYLIKALAQLLNETKTTFKLTIVFGRHGELIEDYKKLSKDLGINTLVDLVDFVDFSKEPDYFNNFDLFVLPSTFSRDGMFKTETFGVSTLEAIASGLPVIVTNAGASKEVVGDNITPYAKVVNHASSNAIFDALVEMLKNKDTFSNNKTYADDVLANFSETKQLESFDKVIESSFSRGLNVSLFSSDVIAGAGGAAHRCHSSFLDMGINSRLYCRNFGKLPTNSDIQQIEVLNSDYYNSFNILNHSTELRDGYTIFSIDEHHIDNKKLYDIVKDTDVISLHWTARFVSYENIAFLSHLNIPIVLTLRDMFYLAGGCHYFHGCNQWQSTCAGCPQLPQSHFEIASESFRYKANNWNFDNITLVVLSDISKDIALKSSLFKNSEIIKINNGFSSEYMTMYDQGLSRVELNLPIDKYLLLYIPSYESKIKGGEEALNALRILHKRNKTNIVLVTAGSAKLSSYDTGFEVINLGYISDKSLMSKLYSAVDSTLVPSLEETFSNTCAEALLCGSPVVGFRAGAIPEMVIDGKTGLIANNLDAMELSEKIYQITQIEFDRNFCRSFILDNFSASKQASSYDKLFTNLVKKSKKEKELFETALSKIDRRSHSGFYYTTLKLKNLMINRKKGDPINVSKALPARQKNNFNFILMSVDDKQAITLNSNGKLSLLQKPSQLFEFKSEQKSQALFWMICDEKRAIVLFGNDGKEIFNISLPEIISTKKTHFSLHGSSLIQRKEGDDEIISIINLKNHLFLPGV